jgi:outer membrane lipoprotein-sorting protein
MRNAFHTWMRVILAGALALALVPPARARKGKHTDVAEILARMKDASKGLQTVSANLEYTKVTVLVDDKSTQSGQFYFRKGKTPDIRIDFQKPEPKVLLLRKNKGEIYLPKINQIQEYNLEQKGDILQEFWLLGFGTDTSELKKVYNVKYLEEEDIGGDTNVVLELTPRKQNVAAQISKIQLWVSEESWLPTQQKFFESGGDYAIARYSGVKVNWKKLPPSTFELKAPATAKRVKMN